MSITDTSVLTPAEQDLLKFILDTTAERWADDNDTQVQQVADDPSYSSMDEMLATAKTLSDLPLLVASIRNKLFPSGN